jgi:hypothetical protein
MAIPKLRETSDDRLEIAAIGNRIGELALLPFSKATKKRLEFLNTRLHECPADVKEKGKAAIRNWNAAHPVPHFVLAAPTMLNVRLPNVMAGLLVSAADEKRGYKLKSA